MECEFCGRYKGGYRFCSDQCYEASQAPWRGGASDYQTYARDRVRAADEAFDREVDRAQRRMERLFGWSEDDQS